MRLLAGLNVSPDGKLLAWGYGPALRLTDLETGKDKTTSAGHAGAPRELQFARDGKTMLTGGDDGTLRRWDTATGKELAEVALPGKGYNFLVPSPDGLPQVLGRGGPQLLELVDHQHGPRSGPGHAGERRLDRVHRIRPGRADGGPPLCAVG